jgi:hypothetical protein
MVGDRSRYGLFVSGIGAMVLAASIFLPWYDTGALAHHALGGAAGAHPLAADALDAIPGLSVVLLVLAGLAMLDALAPLARVAGPVPGGAGGSVVLLGLLAGACVLYRMVDPPALGALTATSLREGAWLALLGSLAMALGGMWPRYVYPATGTDATLPGVWPRVSAGA